MGAGAGAGAADWEQATDIRAARIRPRKTTTLETTIFWFSSLSLPFSLVIFSTSREERKKGERNSINNKIESELCAGG